MITEALNSSAADSSSQLTSLPSKVLDKDDFLNLLITQLQNQDPLNPTDSFEFTAQLTQFSSLEQLSNVNDNLNDLKNFQASINNSQAVSLIGKTVTANGSYIRLTADGPVACNFELEDDAALVVANIYDSAGEFVKAFESSDLSAGQNSLFWDGTDKNGNQMPEGGYTFEVLAADINGNDVDVSTYFTGLVEKVTFENNASFLIAAGQKIALGDVVQVAVSDNEALGDTAESDSTSQASQSATALTNGGK
jgi:flagellar basal-body rod modification protein FlgD